MYSSKEFGLYPEDKEESLKYNFRTRELLSANIWNWYTEWIQRIKDRRRKISEVSKELMMKT